MDFQTNGRNRKLNLTNLKRILNEAHSPTERANLLTLKFGKQSLVKVMTRKIN
jgi:hypothetical protein